MSFADPFKKEVVVHIRMIEQGRRKTTIIQNLPEEFMTKEVLKKFNKVLCCSGYFATDPIYGDVIKLMGNHREAVKNILIEKGVVMSCNIIIHGI